MSSLAALTETLAAPFGPKVTVWVPLVLLVRVGGWQAGSGRLPPVVSFDTPQALNAVARSTFSFFAFDGALCCASAGVTATTIERPALTRNSFTIDRFLIWISLIRVRASG